MVISIPLCAQNKKKKISLDNKMTNEMLNPENEWGEGSVMLNDGEELKGLIRYNEKTGILSFESGSTSRSFTSKDVAGFEYQDPLLKKQRIFYSLEYEDPKNSIKQPLFFEVIKDFKTFVVLSKTDPIEIKDKVDYTSDIIPTRNVFPDRNKSYYVGTEVTQTITIYFMNGDGNLEPFIKSTKKVTDRLLLDTSKVKSKKVDRDIIEKYFTPEELDLLSDYAEKNKLDFKEKDDFIQILDYYEKEIWKP
jgi:hypothetical protein